MREVEGTVRTSDSSVRRSQYWMRSVSFAGLHRILNLVSESPLKALRASEIDALVLERGVANTLRGTGPAPTTAYHYRNTLLQLRLLRRDGRLLRINEADPDVQAIVDIPCVDPASRDLPIAAMDHFASLLLRNHQCRSLFFDLFMPVGEEGYSLRGYRHAGTPVVWRRMTSKTNRHILFHNETTGRTKRYMTRLSITAIPYGLRYWARDELQLLDEYFRGADGSTVMFPVLRRSTKPSSVTSTVAAVRWLLRQRDKHEWKSLSIPDTIVNYCRQLRIPRNVVFDAITHLVQRWPYHVVLIPTSPSLATISAMSPKAEVLALRNYYRAPDGRYISHVRIHKEIPLPIGGSETYE